MRKYNKIICLMLFILLLVSVTGCKDKACKEHIDENNDNICDVCGEEINTTPPTPPIDDTTEFEYGEYNKLVLYEKLFGNEREYKESEFLNPSVSYRMLAVINDDATNPKGANIPNIDTLKDYGYGGLVTNVSWGKDYLENDMAWEYLEEAIEHAIENLGLRVMIYDEKYYPSGAAGGATLKVDNDYQAYGLSQKGIVVEAGKTKSIETPKGYNLLAAVAYKGMSIATIDLTTATPCEVDQNNRAKFANNTTDDYLMVCFYSKYWYEHTHPQANIMQSRRYIDLTNDAPTKEFMKNTYEVYKEHLGKYFNNGIENFFFDEPALPGQYMGKGTQVYAPDPGNEPDETMELLDTINFGLNVLEEFKENWGYDLEPYFPYLFKSNSSLNNSIEAQRVRWHYNETIANMVAKNYFGVIGEWCAKNNISSSGHMLSEENLGACAIYSGNIMRDYSNVQIPGIDLLSANPESIARNYLLTLKTVSSAAQYQGKQHVFCEISDWGEQNTDWNARIASVAVQYAYGINDFVSYYTPFNYDKETNKKLTDTTARIGYMLDGGVSEKNVIVYYPIESVFSYTSVGCSNGKLNNLVSNYESLLRVLSTNNIDYMLADTTNMLDGSIANGKFITPSGLEFKTIVIPEINCMPLKLVKRLVELSNAGIRIILQNDSNIICEKEELQDEFNTYLTELKNSSNCTVKSSVSKIYEYINNSCDARFITVVNNSAGINPIVAIKQKNSNNSVYLVVNTNSTSQQLTITFTDSGTVKAWDVTNGSTTIVDGITKKDSTTIQVTLDGYGCMVYTIE